MELKQGVNVRNLGFLNAPCAEQNVFRSHQPATMFTSFLGTTMIFLTVLPSMKGLTFSEALAAASNSAWEALAGMVMTSRSLPLTWTGIWRVLSTSNAGSNLGQGA